MLEFYKEYKSLSKQRKRWYRRALYRRIRDYLGLVVLLLLMTIELP